MPGLLDDLWKLGALSPPEPLPGMGEAYVDYTKSPSRRVLSFLPLVLLVLFLCLLRDN